uniref:PLAT domain-containing protein n=1 Tax=Macrostomum lignano TaxID=282301 RepID=A0A1I8H1N9_9PLAT
IEETHVTLAESDVNAQKPRREALTACTLLKPRPGAGCLWLVARVPEVGHGDFAHGAVLCDDAHFGGPAKWMVCRSWQPQQKRGSPLRPWNALLACLAAAALAI